MPPPLLHVALWPGKAGRGITYHESRSRHMATILELQDRSALHISDLFNFSSNPFAIYFSARRPPPGLGQDGSAAVSILVSHVISILLLPGNSSCCAAMVILPAPPHDPPHPSRHEALANHVSQGAQPLSDPDVAVLLRARCLGGDLGGTSLRINSFTYIREKQRPGKYSCQIE